VNRPTVLALVGGMLGAGKTTLILEAARRLSARGLRVAVITNDQGEGLVDTALARAEGLTVGEVAGGCFCCRLSDLMSAIEAVAPVDPDVIFAEPVGSCVDLAATVVRPLLAKDARRFVLAPLTVLVDPSRARDVARNPDGDLAYLFSHQVAEADVVLLSKADARPSPPPGLPEAQPVSAVTGEGVDGWLDLLLGGSRRAGARVIEVDYARYGAAEAALAWLNWRVRLHLPIPELPVVVVGRLVDDLDASLAAARLDLVHLKVLDQAPTGTIRVSLVESGALPGVEGRLDASASVSHDLLINVRALGAPEVLAQVVHEALAPFRPYLTIDRQEAFRPAPPTPERRA